MKSYLTLLIYLICNFAVAQTQLTKENWPNHPNVANVREVFSEVNKLVEQNALKSYKHDLGSTGEYTHKKEAFVDSELKIRLLKVHQSSEMGTYDAHLYYDSSNSLRFIYIVEADYLEQNPDKTPKKVECRIYYNPTSGSSITPFWIVKSLNGKPIEFGTQVNLQMMLKDLNIKHPYDEFHDTW